MNSQKDAACLIIGNEILSGRTLDINSNYIAKKLYEKGIDLKEVRVVLDKEEQIILSTRALSTSYDYLFVTGGIGPTHDDITIQSIAKAYNIPLEINESALKIMEDFYSSKGEKLNEGRIRMAKLPKGSKLILNNITAAPGFMINNIYVMAGIPKIMHSMLDNALSFIPCSIKNHEYSIRLSIAESLIASDFTKLQQKYPQVSMGSYPSELEKNKFSTELVLKSKNRDYLDQAVSDLKLITQKFIK